MKIKLVIAVLLTYCVSILSMTPDGQKVLTDPLKPKVASQLNGCSDIVSSKVLEIINQRKGANNTTEWNAVVSDLTWFERFKTLPRMHTGIALGLSAINLGWLAYPAIKVISNSEDSQQICAYKSLDPYVPAIEVANGLAVIFSIYLLLKAIGVHGGCSTPEKLSLNLRRYLKNQQDVGNDVTAQGLNSIISRAYSCRVKDSIDKHDVFTKAITFCELSDGTIDVAQFEKFLPRSYGIDPIIRNLIIASCFMNVFFSGFCAPSVWTEESESSQERVGLAAFGFILAFLNTGLSGVLVSPQVPTKKDIFDIRNVINTIQGDLQSESLKKID